MTEKQLIDLFNKSKSDYQKKEIGSGVVNFVKKIFTDFLSLKEESSYKIAKKNTFTHESTKGTGSNSNTDFILNYKGIKIVVEVEKTGNIEPGIKQIEDYMNKEDTPYAILTDGENWYFYNNGFKKSEGKFGGGIYKSLNDFLNDSGKAFFNSFFETKNYYINFLNRIDVESYHFNEESLQKDLKSFHNELIEVAEKLKADFEKSGIFNENHNEKEVIQTVYSFIIQFLLIKIIQDKKKNLNLINKQEFVKLLDEEKYNALANNIFKQIDWLGKFYTSYQNEQKHLVDKILTHYSDGPFGTNIGFEAIQGFLDLYIFIYKFNFYNVKQDIFGAVYENYLKELYKDDNSKKGQVFTPPEIVDFMLDEIGYNSDYIYQTIESYVKENGIDKLKENLLINEKKPNFNIPGLSIIDPSCGSGTFLYKASSRIVQAILKINNKYFSKIEQKYAGILSENLILNNIFGFDIEAFPLYLAEMNILQTLLWFNIDDNNGEVLNKIDKQVRIFSTIDTIGEFANIENDIDSILENLEKEGIFSVSEKRSPKAISELKLDIINGDLDTKLDKYLVNYIGKDLLYVDKDLEKKLSKFDSIQDLKKYVENSGNELLKGYLKNLLSRDKTKNGKGIYIDKLKDLALKYKTTRTKFDFVIGNPPYVAYNAINKNVRNNWKDIGLEMGNVFGINLHSIPGHTKKYSPKPNLYSYFGALAYFLSKDNASVSYIVPEGFIAYDCNTYYLSEKVNLQKLYFFNTKVFVDRGVNGKMEVATSAIIYKYQKNNRQEDLQLLSYKKKKDEDIKSILDYMRDGINVNLIEKKLIKPYVSTGFNILKQDKKILEFLDYYKKNSDDLSIYYEHENKDKPVDDNFYFDIGYHFDESNRNYDISGVQNNYYNYFSGKGVYYANLNNEGWVKDKSQIGLLQASQGYNLLDSKYKIIWNKTIGFGNTRSFYFDDREQIWARNNFNGIGSNNLREILYLFSLFNSKISWKIFDFYNKKPGETREYGIFLYTLREQIRVPKLDSDIKEKLKQKLIKNGEEIIDLMKKGGSSELKYRDILETEINGLDEIIVGLKDNYSFLDLDYKSIKREKLDNNLSDEILEKINTKNDLPKLEKERDLLVYCLYFGDENGDEDYMNLSKIDLENIINNESVIIKNKWVSLIENS